MRMPERFLHNGSPDTTRARHGTPHNDLRISAGPVLSFTVAEPTNPLSLV